MKYVKTKDSIIERSRIRFLPNNKAELSDERGSWQVDDLQIISEADSVEDLFDEVVIYQKGFLTPEVSKVSLSEIDSWYGEDNDHRERTIHGAIWTIGEHGEPILRSVAKKTEGGWELT